MGIETGIANNSKWLEKQLPNRRLEMQTESEPGTKCAMLSFGV